MLEIVPIKNDFDADYFKKLTQLTITKLQGNAEYVIVELLKVSRELELQLKSVKEAESDVQ